MKLKKKEITAILLHNSVLEYTSHWVLFGFYIPHTGCCWV